MTQKLTCHLPYTRLAIPLLLASAALADAHDAAPVLSVADAKRITAAGAKYEVEAEVISTTRYWSAVRDESGVMQVRNWTKPWRNGDMVRMTVEMSDPAPEKPGYVRQIARASTVTGHREPPPPREVTADVVSRGSIAQFSPVVLRGTVTSAFPDEIDGSWSFLVVESEGEQALVSMGWPDASLRADLSHLVDAEVTVNGVFLNQGNDGRQFMGRNVLIQSTNSISVVRAAPPDPFAEAKPIDLAWPVDIASMTDGRRRKATGTVAARWTGRNFILKTDAGPSISARVPLHQPLPEVGDRVEAAGFVRHTPFVVKLSNALWRKIDGSRTEETPIDIDARRLFSDESGNAAYNVRYHGRLIRIKGTVTDILGGNAETPAISLNCNGAHITVVAEGTPLPKVGSVVEATGVCIARENPDPDDLTRLEGLMLVLRSEADLKVLRMPPWWTPRKLSVVIALLLVSIACISAWVMWLNRLVKRRSRELMKEQLAHAATELRVGERTRLAVELHDSLSQSLAALSFQLSSARTAKSAGMDDLEATHLSRAEKMLDSCRIELRHCLWDLRSNSLEERNLETAIRKTLQATAPDAEISIDFDVPRSRMDDTTAHATIMIVRELVSNAIRHGGAKHVDVTGSIDGGKLTFSVTDDGSGFDPGNRPGLNEGHFGLAGVQQRVSGLGGEFSIRSSPGKGATATVSFKITNHSKHAGHDKNTHTAR